MSRRTLARVAIATTLAASVLTGTTAVSASAAQNVASVTKTAATATSTPTLDDTSARTAIYPDSYTRW